MFFATVEGAFCDRDGVFCKCHGVFCAGCQGEACGGGAGAAMVLAGAFLQPLTASSGGISSRSPVVGGIPSLYAVQ